MDMTEFTSRADIALDINNFMAGFWGEIEKNEGQRAADYFVEDGVFDSKMVCFNGRQEIRDWFAWRKDTVRTARHLLSNLQFDFAAWDERQEVEVRGIMTHYGEFGKGVLPVGPPIGIYDYYLLLRRGGPFGWTIIKLVNDPVFVAPDHVAKRYKGSGAKA
jgi:SnoaL-like domain